MSKLQRILSVSIAVAAPVAFLVIETAGIFHP
jgi:hypothetical protein